MVSLAENLLCGCADPAHAEPQGYISLSVVYNITIFAAELHVCAIKLALQWVISNSDENDSYSSLQAIASGKSKCRPNLLLQVIGLVSKYSKNVDFEWLPSHIGIKGNEIADKLANAATRKPSIDVNIGLEVSESFTLVTDTFLGSGNIYGIRKPQGHTTGQ